MTSAFSRSGVLAAAAAIFSVAACSSTTRTTGTGLGADGGSDPQGRVACGGARGDVDCAPWTCSCEDGATPAIVFCDRDGYCAPADVACPSECTRGQHGAWTGAATGGGRAATTGKTPAGGACAGAAACVTVSCKCGDGTLADNAGACSQGVCLGRADVCTGICNPRGGWVDP